MPELSGKQARIYINGSPVQMTNEAMQSSDGKTYKIVNDDKKLFDPNQPLIVKIGGSNANESYKVIYPQGVVEFIQTNLDRGAVTVTGAYCPRTLAISAYKASFKESCDLKDATCFIDESGKNIAGTIKGEFKISAYDTMDTYYNDEMKQGKQIYIEYDSHVGDPAPTCAWGLITEVNKEAEIDGIQTMDISVSTVGDY